MLYRKIEKYIENHLKSNDNKVLIIKITNYKQSIL